jgi:competence ComEA-like helix-hairpin-helix protein
MEGIRMKRFISLLFVFFLGLSPLVTLAVPVNINTADAKVLDSALVGVGAKTAKAIVEHRTKHGQYKSVDDLLKVKGIGPALLEKNRPNITVK